VDQAFEIFEHDEGGLLRIAVSGEVDVATAPTLRERLYDAVDRSSEVVIVDLLAVTFIDSTGLGVLIGTQERGNGQGTQVHIVVREPRIVKIFEITGLTELFTMYPTVAEAAAP
jgi:anti-sigma B factor antagonist